MRKYKVCVYAICKNEVDFVDRWMDSMGEADEIIVTDTGSDDGTVERLRERGATVYVDIIKPWRFDVARNVSLDHVPKDVDICVCTDLDELFEKGWRAALEKAWSENEALVKHPVARSGRYLYNWSLKPDGTPDTQFTYFKVHQREDFHWRYPIHEIVGYKGKLPVEAIYIEGMVLNHYPDATKSRGSYLPLLEMAMKETPTDDRIAYYLGREYMYAGEWQKCIDTMKIHISLPSATWNEERGSAMRAMGKSYYRLGDTKGAYSWYHMSMGEAPHMRESYVDLAQIAYETSDWVTALYATEEALKITQKSPTYVNAGYVWSYTPHDLCAIACYRLGLYALALKHAGDALKYEPENERLQNNYKLIEEALNQK